MRTNLQIALRFLLAKKRAMAMSLAGIAFGVGFIVLTQAITAGFQEFFVQTILGTNGAIKVEDKYQALVGFVPVEGSPTDARMTVAVESERRYQEGISDPRLVRNAVQQFPDVTGISEVVRGSGTLQSATREDSAEIIGIELADHVAVSDLENQIVAGTLEKFRELPSGIVIGSALAERLRLSPGNSVLLIVAGQSTRYKVAAIYETGVREIDRVRVFLHLSEARTLLKRPNGASFLQLSLKDPGRAVEVAQQMEATISHRATSWQEREKMYLGVFQFFQIAAAIMVSTIIIVAGLGMFNTLAMIVMEKTKEIAILRSMGFTRDDIAMIFMLQGSLVLVAGLAAGWALGAGSTLLVESLPFSIRGIFSTDHIVVAWRPAHYWGSGLAAAVVVLIASWLPARRAARLEPAAIIRGASQ